MLQAILEILIFIQAVRKESIDKDQVVKKWVNV